MRKYNNSRPLALAFGLMATIATSGNAGAFVSNTPGLPVPPASPFPGAPWTPPVAERETAPDGEAESQKKPVDRGLESRRTHSVSAPHKASGEREDGARQQPAESGRKQIGQQAEPPARGNESERMPGNNTVLKPGENFEQTPPEDVAPAHGNEQNGGKLPGTQPKPAPDSPDQSLRPKPKPTPWRDPAPRSHDRPWIDVLPDLPL